MMLEQIVERLYAQAGDTLDRDDAAAAVAQLKDLLNAGGVRAAEPTPAGWRVNAWVKKGILLAFRIGAVKEIAAGGFTFFDKDTVPLRSLSPADRVRVVPGGTAVRDGAYVGPGVVIMPPAYVNIGAFVDENTMIDSHALVGSCAQVGRRVHLSAAAQVGGVLEPIGSMPVIIEDDVFVGGNTGIYEGTIVQRRAVIGAGVVLTGSTPVYDIVRSAVYRKAAGRPLVIPEGAVVVPGSRKLDGAFADEHRLSLTAPVIIKYRDERTDAATVLEESLR